MKTPNSVCWPSRTASPPDSSLGSHRGPRPRLGPALALGVLSLQQALATFSRALHPLAPGLQTWPLPKELGKLRDCLKFAAQRPGTCLPSPRCLASAGLGRGWGDVRWEGVSGSAEASLRAHLLAPAAASLRAAPASLLQRAPWGKILTLRGVGILALGPQERLTQDACGFSLVLEGFSLSRSLLWPRMAKLRELCTLLHVKVAFF